MPERTFVIRIGELDGERYPVEVMVCEGTELATHRSAFVPAASMPASPLSLGRNGLTAATLTDCGAALHGLICSEELRPAWDAAAAAPSRLLLDVRASKLRGLPWELLYNYIEDQWLFEDEIRPAARGEYPFPATMPRLYLPVRLLVLIGDPENEQILQAEQELHEIYAGLRDLHCCWQVDVLRGADRTTLGDQLRNIQPHILHFVGHGTVNELDEPALEVAGSNQELWPLTAQFIKNTFVKNALAKKNGRKVEPPRLVVLNACRTAQRAGGTGQRVGGKTPQDVVRGLVDAFLDSGTGAVVAMQGDIQAESAVRASATLYAALAAGVPIDAAIAKARYALHLDNSFRAGDWALPTLTVRANPDEVIGMPPQLDADRLLNEDRQGFADLRWFVDRTTDRQEVWRRIDPDAVAAAPDHATRNIVFLTGAKEVGKSTLARACVLTAHLRGLRVVHVELPDDQSVDWPELLDRIAAAVPCWLPGEDPQVATRAFRNELREIVNLIDPFAPATVPPRGVSFALPRLPDLPLGAPDYLDQAFERFRSFLKAVAGEQPLLIAVDNVGRMDELDVVVRHLFRRANECEPALLLVVGCPDALEAVLPGELQLHRVVPVQPFRKQDAPRLAAEFCVRRRAKYRMVEDARWNALVGDILARARQRADAVNEELMPSELGWWETIYKRDQGVS